MDYNFFKVLRRMGKQSLKNRLHVIGKIMNHLLIQGYSNDMVDWNKLNKLLNFNRNATDFNAFGKIESFSDLKQVYDLFMEAEYKEGVWYILSCKKCNEKSAMTKSEFRTYTNQYHKLPTSCEDIGEYCHSLRNNLRVAA